MTSLSTKKNSEPADLVPRAGRLLLKIFFSFATHVMLSFLLFTMAPGPIVIIAIIWAIPVIQVVAVVTIFALRENMRSAVPWIVWPVFWACLNVVTTNW